MAKRNLSTRRRAPRTRTARASHADAQAFRDAVRDILAADGIFSLADERERDTLYHFDGVSWKREQLPRAAKKRAQRRQAPTASPNAPNAIAG